MAIAKLKLLTIDFPSEKYDSVLMKLINTDNFHPEPASQFADSVEGLSILNRENPYADLLSKMDESQERFNIQYKKEELLDSKLNIVKANEYFCNIMTEVEKIEKVKKELLIMIEENEEAAPQLEHLINSNLDFDKMFACKYLQIKFGRMPAENIDKLQYYGDQEFLLKIFHKDVKETYCCYITTLKHAPKIDNIFSSLYFKQIQIPNFVHGTASEALSMLKEETDTGKEYIKELDERIKRIFDKELDKLNQIYNVSYHMNQTFDAQKYVVVFGRNASIYGFAEEKNAKKLKEYFEEIEDVHVEIKPATGDSRLTPPTKLTNNWITKPFKMFVEMYGVPSYTDFDPTNLVAITYTFLFGMMFGDIGQGLLLSLVGYVAYKLKGMKLGEVGMRIGISSALFGVVYGSFFGNEEIFTPMFHTLDPNNTMPLLGIAIGTGVTLIIISIIFNIIINIKKKKMADVYFSQNGFAGLVFYIAVLLLVVQMLLGIDLPVGGTFYTIIFIAMPVLMIFLKEPLEHKMDGEPMFPHGFGGFFTEAFFELFEVMLTFIANTMSFLRVGGFVLSHAGMMLVVYTLAEMIGGFGYWIVLVFGNIFVMVLEGMIVGIQVLRLEFYEMFSRYYEGKGIPFKTIKER